MPKHKPDLFMLLKNPESLITFLLSDDCSVDDVNARDRLGNPLIALAAKLNHAELVEKLLDKGADPRIKDIDGNTALDWANHHNNKEMFNILYKSLSPSGSTNTKRF